MALTDEVFGIRAEPVLSYLPREGIDNEFARALASDHHIVIYGSSKQGKTSLRQKNLPDNNIVIVRCSPVMTPEGIYSSILRQAGVRVQTIQTQQTTESGKITTTVGFKANVPPFTEASASLAGELGTAEQGGLTEEFVSFNFAEAQSIGELLDKVNFNKLVVLENYHYLPIETQQQLAFDLKTFHEARIRFIIMGIWWEANHLLTFNQDLDGRIVEIPVEPWRPEDFEAVAREGSRLLKIQIDASVLEKLTANSYGNIGMLQDFLKEYCHACGITETVPEPRQLNDELKVEEVFGKKLASQKNQLLRTLQIIANRSRVRSEVGDPLLLPYYLSKVICTAGVDLLKGGVDRGRLLELIRNIHHRPDKDTIRIGDITNLFTRLPSLQKDIQPPFLYADTLQGRLNIVDARQFFVLARVDGNELADAIANPRDRDEE